jgi:hypothetical protein
MTSDVTGRTRLVVGMTSDVMGVTRLVITTTSDVTGRTSDVPAISGFVRAVA